MSAVSTTTQRESSGGRVVVLTVLGLIVLFGGLYVAAYAFAGEKVPRGASVAGVDIGGRTHADAVAVLEEGLLGREAIDVTVDGRATQVGVDEVGLDVDVESSVEAAGGGRSWAPARLWDYYTGGDDLAPVLTWDETVFAEGMDVLDGEFGTPPREGRVGFSDGEVTTRPGRPGEVLDRVAARDALAAAYVEDSVADLDLVAAHPEIDAADVQRALNRFANRAVSGPVTLVFERTRVRLTPADYSPVLGMAARDGRLEPSVKRKRLNALVRSHFSADQGAPVDATVALVDGTPKVVPSKPGVDFKPRDVVAAFLEVVSAEPGEREIGVKATVKRAEFRTRDARRLKIRERVSSFTTYYPHANYRNVNLGRASALIDGTVLKPGETFSMNETVGERTVENGFVAGTIISNGVYKEELGGSVSQMATTLFNAMFFAGLEDVEHRPHSFYISRYPVGREATVVWGALDLSFRNDTEYGVLIDTSITPSTSSSQGAVTVTMYSTKKWDITTDTSERYNYTDPDTRTIRSEDCIPNNGYRGFDIDVYRYFRRAGSDELVRREKFHTTYTPSDNVICRAPEEPDEPDGA